MKNKHSKEKECATQKKTTIKIVTQIIGRKIYRIAVTIEEK